MRVHRVPLTSILGTLWVTGTTLAPAAVIGSELKTGLGTGSDIALGVGFAAVFIAAAYGFLRVLAARVRRLRCVGSPVVAGVVGTLAAVLLALTLLSPVFALGVALIALPLMLLGILGGGLARVAMRRGLRRPASIVAVGSTLAVQLVTAQWLLSPGASSYYDVEATLPATGVVSLNARDPSAIGQYAVQTLTYGSGVDKRPEYGAQADLITPTVDASRLMPPWSGWKGDARARFWGFDPRTIPLNGRVWLPSGAGPFPLVLIVHGNAHMADPSELGYAYLGRLLASRGFIVASVDQNFLNASWADDLQGDNPARAWLLLEHLQTWRVWNASADHPLEGKVDLDNVALIGHSRGGEAVAVAALFNRLPHLPEDPAVAFDYGFGIKGVIAIAPTDGMYRPDGRLLALEDIDFLGLQGDYDGGGTPPIINRQYQRVSFAEGSDSAYGFKASVVVHHANHGQFNTVWGRQDFPPPLGWLLNTRPIMDGEAQRQVAQVYVSAFLEASLRGDLTYIPLLTDHRVGGHWLPRDRYVTAFADSRTRTIGDFDSSALPVRLEWTADDAGSQAYEIPLQDEAPATSGADERQLVLSLAEATGAAATPDFSIELVERSGAVARRTLSAAGPLHAPSGVRPLKALNDLFAASDERVPHTYVLPLANFEPTDSAFDSQQLRSVRLRFDQSPAGAVLISSIGIRSTREQGSVLTGSAASAQSGAPIDFDAIDSYVEAQRRDKRIPGMALAIVRDRDIVHMRGYGVADSTGRAVTPQTPFIIGSLTKSFTALAIMQLVEAGKLELDAPVQRYVPWFAVTDPQASARITVRHLLYHSSGLPAGVGNAGMANGSRDEQSLEREVRALRTIELSQPVGATYQYSTAGYITLGLIVQAVSGQSYESYVETHILQPLGMRQSFTSKGDAREHGLASGHRYWFGLPVAADLPYARGVLPAGYLIASAEDMGRYLIPHLNGGRSDGAAIVSSSGMAELLRPGIEAGGRDASYAMGWSVIQDGDVRVIGHAGGTFDFRGAMSLVPERGLGMVVLMNADAALGRGQLTGIADGVYRTLLGREVPAFESSPAALIVYGVLIAAVSVQIAGMVRTALRLGEWRTQPRQPRGRWALARRIVLPGMMNLTWAGVTLVVLPTVLASSLTLLILQIPDIGYVLLASGATALGWAAARTALVMRALHNADRGKADAQEDEPLGVGSAVGPHALARF